ncbi:hypothetical protein [Devosia sp. MC521]|uniref:hypothetical protein n=1 Tax=Devosia sp. MC521 TaxID=2759954 RepID=UPI0015F97E3D|nr:hypothetical protein [Devosia sp. MC521]MBJ6986923.1 hypothetical protein [Devosia sp. MC521]QMW63947.1 hypothetical protein H4N61_06425 [Devosia sp. MC521]
MSAIRVKITQSEEIEYMAQHVARGEAMLASKPELQRAVDISRSIEFRLRAYAEQAEEGTK